VLSILVPTLRPQVKVLKQSLRKVEQACYSIQVRGSEIPKVGPSPCPGPRPMCVINPLVLQNHLADIFTSDRRDVFTDCEGSGRGEEEDHGYYD
jgi:hypothetical protein